MSAKKWPIFFLSFWFSCFSHNNMYCTYFKPFYIYGQMHYVFILIFIGNITIFIYILRSLYLTLFIITFVCIFSFIYLVLHYDIVFISYFIFPYMWNMTWSKIIIILIVLISSNQIKLIKSLYISMSFCICFFLQITIQR